MTLLPPLKSSDLTSGTWSWISASGSGDYGSWSSSTSSLSGWWWSTGEHITFEGTIYADSGSVVLDANNNGIYDHVDYEIFYGYASGMDESGTWTFNTNLLEGVVSSGSNAGILRSTVSFSYQLLDHNNSTIGTLNSDVITTYQGIDTIDARSGNDIINAGAGNDRILGGDGSDTAVYSGKFNDYLFIRISDELRVAM